MISKMSQNHMLVGIVVFLVLVSVCGGEKPVPFTVDKFINLLRRCIYYMNIEEDPFKKNMYRQIILDALARLGVKLDVMKVRELLEQEERRFYTK